MTSSRLHPALCGLLLSLLPHLPAISATAHERAGLPEEVAFDPGNVKIKGESGIHLQQASIARLNDDRWAFRLRFSEAPQFLFHSLALNFNFDDSDATGKTLNSRPGTDLLLRINKQQVSAEFSASEIAIDRAWALALQEGSELLVVCNLPGFPAAEVSRVRLFSRIKGNGGTTQDAIQMTQFPRVASRELPDLPRPELADWQLVLPPEAYAAVRDPSRPLPGQVDQSSRKHGIFYSGKADRGLIPSQLPRPSSTPFRFPRATPLPAQVGLTDRLPTPKESAVHLPVTIAVTNETGEPRPGSRVRFGFPLPKGAYTAPEQIDLFPAEESAPLAAHRHVLSRWDDGSLRALLFDFRDDFAAREQRSYRVAPSAANPASSSPFVTSTPRGWLIATAGGTYELLRQSYSPIHHDTGSVLFPQGVLMEGDHGALYSTIHRAPRSVSVEESSDSQVTFRLEGDYTSPAGQPYMSYVSRITFSRHSPLISLAHTHINTELSHEFSDLRRLELPLGQPLPGSSAQAGLLNTSGSFAEKALSPIRQWDDERYGSDPSDATPGRITGAFRVAAPSGGGVTAWIEHAWQRWPKGFRIANDQPILELLPALPSGFGSDLPIPLRFPFVEDAYRLKWGMAFTERLTIDPTGHTPLATASAEAQSGLVAVIPASWYAATEAFGATATGDSPLHQRWDAFFDHSFRQHEKRRQQQREYGFLNYGDWFGERARNWGNNEYDTAHAFFTQFMRTGDPELFRSAIVAARHQADVDIVHAYPDASVIGGNVLHGIGHTGTSSHLIDYGTWSAPLHVSASPNNGHTWSEGMIEAWWMAGDAACLESALKLAENMCWVYAPSFHSGEKVAPRKAGWALRALSRLYEATNDPAYKEAAHTIAHGVIPFQDPATGAWFWDVPLRWSEIHESRKQTSPGAQTWQLGILLAGLRTYWSATGDPAVVEPIGKLGGFLERSWVKNGGWPYITAPDGGAHPSRPNFNTGMNGIISQGLLPIAPLSADAAAQRASLVRAALLQMIEEHDVVAAGQRIGYTLRDPAITLGLLEQLERKEKK